MQLIACSRCHAQYDVEHLSMKSISCRCGAQIEIRRLNGSEAQVKRCSACGAKVGAAAPTCEYCGSTLQRDPARLSLICPECYARNARTARFCAACGVAFQPEPIQTTNRELPCPGCGNLMPVRHVGEVPMHECPQCHGIWLPENRFDQLVARMEQEIASHGFSRPEGIPPRVKSGDPTNRRIQYRHCPVCNSFMARRNFEHRSGVILDRCPEHGTWLDADELEQIAGFLRRLP